MFDKCHKCGIGGLECRDDYALLKSGYWWEWRNETHKDRYKYFIKNLLAPSPALDVFSIEYPYPIPTSYRCPIGGSCEGGLDSPCGKGYEGQLCGVCSSGHHKQLQTCKQCPSKRWMVGQLLIIASVVLIIGIIVVWTSKKKVGKNRGHSVIDMFFSKLKIVIGFYQVTYGLLEAFRYIKWPDSLQVIGKYSEILQLNVLQVAPIDCLFPQLHVDAFGNLFATMGINAALIVFSGVAYGVFKVIISRNPRLEENEKLRKLSQTKEVIYRNLFFFLYVTYLSTCSKTANVLPPTCREICRDDEESMCYSYLKADYSIQCKTPKYNQLVIVAYISVAYVIALPAASFLALWRQRRLVTAKGNTKASQNLDSNMEMVTGLKFLFENYKPRTWFWELVEMSRKVILTSGLILVGQESRSYIGLAWVMAGMYGMLFSWHRPIQDVTENRLMATSLAVTVVNLGVGAVSRIPAENIQTTADAYVDAVLFKILVLGANTLVIGQVIVQYAIHLYGYLMEWKKRPQLSFSCCLALLLPLNDLQGEISGMADTDVLDDQLQTGQTDMPTIIGAVQDSGIVDVSFEEGEKKDGSMIVVQDGSRQDGEYKNIKSNRGTQTELLSLSIV
ncbi:uncharacterized protein LOC144629772 [Oculina patagonica]